MQESNIFFYRNPKGNIRVEVFYEDDSFWLTINRMAELYGTSKQNVSYHLLNIYAEGELNREATVKENLTVQTEGGRQVSRKLEYYHLDAIIAVGYRVNSYEATQFRIWATGTLREFVVKGFVLDDERLKQGKRFGKDYFEELLERIREIRASDRRFYQKITDIYAQCSIDYDPKAEITVLFYATVQNKLHWAMTGYTAAEIIAERADADKPHMGLTTWKNAPDGKILKGDIDIAKNYLNEKEITGLNRIVTMYLDYAENQISKGVALTMKDWISKLDAFLTFNEYEVLNDAGTLSHDVAKKLAEKHYSRFRIGQDEHFQSDFDKVTKRLNS